MGDGEPLGQRHHRVLGHAVGSRAELGEQAGSRRGVEEIALAPLDHPRQHRPGRVDVAEDVHRPHPLPGAVGNLHTPSTMIPALAQNRSTGPKVRSRLLDQGDDVALVGHIQGHRQRGVAAGGELRGHRVGAGPIDVGHRHPRAPCSREGPAQGPADPAGPPVTTTTRSLTSIAEGSDRVRCIHRRQPTRPSAVMLEFPGHRVGPRPDLPDRPGPGSGRRVGGGGAGLVSGRPGSRPVSFVRPQWVVISAK